MSEAIEQWEKCVAALWDRFDSLGRDEGIAAMRELTDACPALDGRTTFELASMYDSMGCEAEAGTEYERALEPGLDEAIAILSTAPTHESTGSAPRVVLALALHSAGREDEALRVAIESQIEALPRYQRSLRSYAAALTEPAASGARVTR